MRCASQHERPRSIDNGTENSLATLAEGNSKCKATLDAAIDLIKKNELPKDQMTEPVTQHAGDANAGNVASTAAAPQQPEDEKPEE